MLSFKWLNKMLNLLIKLRLYKTTDIISNTLSKSMRLKRDLPISDNCLNTKYFDVKENIAKENGV